MYYDLDVRADNAKEIEGFSRRLGWRGFCIITDVKNLNTLGKEENVFLGTELQATNKNEIRSASRRVRKDLDLLIGYSNNLEMSRAMVETREIDILRQDTTINLNPVIARKARENGISIEFRFSDLLHSHKRTRSIVFANLFESARVVRKCKTPFVITSGAVTKWDLRAPFDLISFGRLLGFQDPEIKKSLSGMPAIENRKRLSEKWVMAGVEVE